MPDTGRVRNLGATIVGWLLVAVLVYVLFGFLIGTIFWLVRTFLVFVVIGALAWLYFRLKSD